MSSLNADPTFDATTGTYVLELDWTDVDDPGILVVEAVAAVIDSDALSMEPLQYVLDIDSLGSLLQDATAAAAVSVQFEYERTRVALDGGGRLDIQPL
jgi:hypothetical protein